MKMPSEKKQGKLVSQKMGSDPSAKRSGSLSFEPLRRIPARAKHKTPSPATHTINPNGIGVLIFRGIKMVSD